MMRVVGDVLHITKGDNGSLNVAIKNDDGSPYVMGAADTLTLTVREMPSEEYPVLLEIEGTPGSHYLHFMPEHTAGLEVGKYSMDIQLAHDGKITTVCPKFDQIRHGKIVNWKNFVIDAEVTIP